LKPGSHRRASLFQVASRRNSFCACSRMAEIPTELLSEMTVAYSASQALG
jgi:hypothetical protein